jgi:hypothetical protein
MRQGNFSECDETSALYNPVVASNCTLPINPTTGQPFLNNSVPIDPNAQALLDAFVPVPNNGVIGYIAAPTQPTDWREEQIRVDQNISDKTNVFVRYTNDAWNQIVVPSLWTGSSYDTIKTFFDGPAKSAVLHLTHSFKPNLMTEFVMGYTVDHIVLLPQVGSSSVSRSISKPTGWSMNTLFAPNQNNPLLPALSVGGGVPFDSFFESASNHPWYNSNPVITWKHNFAYTRGRHTMKFGWYLMKFRKNEQYGTPTQGILTFDGGSAISTGNGLADMYLGRIAQYQEGTLTVDGVPVGGYPKAHWRSTDFEPYFQDDWKVNRKLTLNLGLRYYYFTRIHDVSRPTTDSGFLPNLYGPANEAQLDADGNLILGSGHTYQTFGNGLVECGKGGTAKGCSLPYYWTLAPRFGFAYDPSGTGKTVIRGGYGWYFEPGNGNEANTEGAEGNPPVALAPSGFNIVGYDNIVPGALGPTGTTAIPYRQKWGDIQQYSLSIQHEFPGNNLLSLSYVGTLGRHLARGRNLNQIPIGVGTLNAPALAGLLGTQDANPDLGSPGNLGQPLCDATGNCDVQTTLIYNEKPNIFFVPFRGYTSESPQGPTMKENTAVSHYNALQVNFRHTTGYGLTFQTAYTWSHNIDDNTSTYNQSGVDDHNLSRWKATSDLNRTHVLVMNYIYDLPFFKQSTNALLKGALGGWRVSGITSFFTGQPLDFNCGVTGFSSGIGGGVRCNSLGPLKIKKGVDSSDLEFGPTPTWFDPNMIGQVTMAQLRADNQPGMFGYVGRNPLTGPGRNNWDLALMKDIQLPWFRGEQSTVQFRWETFNTFNHPQWKSVNAGCGGDTPFGQPCSGIQNNLDNGQVNGAWSPRIMQFGLKFIF